MSPKLNAVPLAPRAINRCLLWVIYASLTSLWWPSIPRQNCFKSLTVVGLPFSGPATTCQWGLDLGFLFIPFKIIETFAVLLWPNTRITCLHIRGCDTVWIIFMLHSRRDIGWVATLTESRLSQAFSDMWLWLGTICRVYGLITSIHQTEYKSMKNKRKTEYWNNYICVMNEESTMRDSLSVCVCVQNVLKRNFLVPQGSLVVSRTV